MNTVSSRSKSTRVSSDASVLNGMSLNEETMCIGFILLG
jgi:hypothetical protein